MCRGIGYSFAEYKTHGELTVWHTRAVLGCLMTRIGGDDEQLLRLCHAPSYTAGRNRAVEADSSSLESNVTLRADGVQLNTPLLPDSCMGRAETVVIDQ